MKVYQVMFPTLWPNIRAFNSKFPGSHLSITTTDGATVPKLWKFAENFTFGMWGKRYNLYQILASHYIDPWLIWKMFLRMLESVLVPHKFIKLSQQWECKIRVVMYFDLFGHDLGHVVQHWTMIGSTWVWHRSKVEDNRCSTNQWAIIKSVYSYIQQFSLHNYRHKLLNSYFSKLSIFLEYREKHSFNYLPSTIYVISIFKDSLPPNLICF